MKRKSRLVVLISGNGSNLQAIIDAVKAKRLIDLDIELVVSNRSKAYGLTRAQDAGIPTAIFPLKPYKDQGKSRQQYDIDLAAMIKRKATPDLIVLAGWMHILSADFLQQFRGQVINLHPALPGQFDGANAIGRAYDSFKLGTIQSTGVMVHWVIPEVDQGSVIMSRKVDIQPDDKLEDLERRIHETEHPLLVDAIAHLLAGGMSVESAPPGSTAI